VSAIPRIVEEVPVEMWGGPLDGKVVGAVPGCSLTVPERRGNGFVAHVYFPTKKTNDVGLPIFEYHGVHSF